MNTYTLIKKDGTREEVPFLIRTINGHQILYVSEFVAKWEADCSWTGKVVIFEPTLQLFNKMRDIIGRPIIINSWFRSEEYQAHLHKLDPINAAAVSPHPTGAAMDLSIPSGLTASGMEMVAHQAGRALGFPVPRTGWRKYEGRFIHVDLVFMLYKPYIAGQTNPRPARWKPGIKW